MLSARNPYNYNMPVSPEMFFGRQGDVEAITRDLTAAPGDSFALIGGRRMGKTSLLEALERSLKASFFSSNELLSGSLLPTPIFLDVSGETINSIADFFQIIGEQVRSDVGNRLDISFPDRPFSEGQQSSSSERFGYVLENWGETLNVKQGLTLRLILLLDECEQIVEKPWTAELYGVLRALLGGYRTRSLIKIVMAGSHRFLTKVRQEGSPLRNILKYHMLGALDSQAALQLITQPTNGIVSEEIAQIVVQQSGGHVFLAQYLMHHLWEYGLERATPHDVRKIAVQFSHERRDFWDWTDNLGESAQKIYATLAQTESALTENRIRMRLPYMPDLLLALDALCYHGLIIHESDKDAYRIAGQMFHQWFLANWVSKIEAPQSSSSLLSTDQQNPIQIQNIIISQNTQIQQQGASGTFLSDAILNEVAKVLQTNFNDLKRGQAAIYHQITEKHNESLNHVLKLVQAGRVEQTEMALTLDAVRRALKAMQASDATFSVEMRSAIKTLSSAVESNLSLQQKLELTLPVIPLFLDYKVELASGTEVDLNAVKDDILKRWQKLLDIISSL